MVNQFTSVAASLLIAGSCFAQVPYPFAIDSAEWKNAFYYSPSPDLEIYDEFKFVAGDSVLIAEQWYNEIFVKKTFSNDEPWLLGGIREDETNKIWFYSFAEGSDYLDYVGFTFPSLDMEFLLYDFNIGTGETMSVKFQDLGTATLTCIDEDSILVNGSMRRYLSMTSDEVGLEPQEWVEGIGSTHNLLYPFINTYVSAGVVFYCFESLNQNENYTWLNVFGQYDACTFPQSVNELSFNHIRLYPNPASDEITIELPHGTGSISITDPSGRLLLHRSAPTMLQVDVSTLPAGIYYITFETFGEPIVERFAIR